jgi:V/A-type H+-transporting ATPase subunit E
MALTHILEALEAEARGQIKEIEEGAEAEVRDIRKETQDRAAAVRRERKRAVEEDLQIEQARILNRAKLEAQQEIMRARETLMADVLEGVRLRLQGISTHAHYHRWMELLTLEAIDSLNSLKEKEGLQVSVQDQAVDLMKGIIENVGVSAAVKGGVDCSGGVVVSSMDGNIRVDNTLDTRLLQATSLYRTQIARIVLGQQ